MNVFKSFSLMSILTFLSRILGYARDLLFAFIFLFNLFIFGLTRFDLCFF